MSLANLPRRLRFPTPVGLSLGCFLGLYLLHFLGNVVGASDFSMR